MDTYDLKIKALELAHEVEGAAIDVVSRAANYFHFLYSGEAVQATPPAPPAQLVPETPAADAGQGTLSLATGTVQLVDTAILPDAATAMATMPSSATPEIPAPAPLPMQGMDPDNLPPPPAPALPAATDDNGASDAGNVDAGTTVEKTLPDATIPA